MMLIPYTNDSDDALTDDDATEDTVASDALYTASDFRRGLNLITPVSGCLMAAWRYDGGAAHMFQDCERWGGIGYENLGSSRSSSSTVDANSVNVNIDATNTSSFVPLMLPNDTVYVTIMSLSSFAETILPELIVPITLITGQFHMGYVFEPELVSTLLHHDMITKWFCHNLGYYFSHSSNTEYLHHAKLEPWPYGMQPFADYPQPQPVRLYKEAFWRYWATPKTKGIMAGYLNPDTNPNRTVIAPSGPLQSLSDYYDEMAQHRFVIAPNGDRPECYRHYEAIGLGVIPLTQLDPFLHRHLAPAPIVYNMTHFWNLTENSNSTSTTNGTESDKGSNNDNQLLPFQYRPTNRRMVTQEYWMEYVDRIVGSPVRWNDVLQYHNPHKRTYYSDFVPELALVQQLQALLQEQIPP